MEIIVPPIFETQLTGFVGSAAVMRGARQYLVRLENGKPPQCFYDGKAVAPLYNATMLKLVTGARRVFNV